MTITQSLTAQWHVWQKYSTVHEDLIYQQVFYVAELFYLANV